MSARPPTLLPPAEAALLDLLAGRARTLPAWLCRDSAAVRHLVGICRTHAIHHLTAGLLRDGGGPSSPAESRLLEELENDQAGRWAFLLAADVTACALADALQPRGIPFCLLKGLALAHTLYRETPLRRCFSDIDILIPEVHFDEAVAAFLELGYRLAAHKTDLAAIRQYGHKLTFVPQTAGPSSVDVHFRPLGKKLFDRTTRLDNPLFWAHRAECTIDGRPFMIPAPELHLIYLCVHLSLQHHLASLNWLYDLRQLAAAGPGPDWSAVTAVAKTCRVERATWLSLRAAADLLDAPVPRAVLRDLEPGRAGLAAGCWFASQLDGANIVARVHHYRQRTILGKMSRMFSEVLLMDRRAERWGSVARWMAPSPMFLRTSYRARGGWRIVFWYLAHPVIVATMAVSLVLLTIRYAVESLRRQRRSARRLLNLA